MKIVLWVAGILLMLPVLLFYGYVYGLPYVAPYWCCRHPYLSQPTLKAVMLGSRWREQHCGYLYDFLKDCKDDYLPAVRAEMLRIARSDHPDYDAYWRLNEMILFYRIEERIELEIIGSPSSTLNHVRKTTLHPWWAKSSGMDQYGPWADLPIGEKMYRLRLVPTGKYRKTIRYFDQRKKQELKPVVKIEIIENEYWLGETEITGSQWSNIMDMKGGGDIFTETHLHPMQTYWRGWEQICLLLNNRYPNLGARLPSEQQWEFACFANGSCSLDQDLDTFAWYRNNSGGKTHPVKLKSPNPWGFYDMQGNVDEWCQEVYQPHWSIEDDSLSIQERNDFRARWTKEMQARILKGGHSHSTPKDCQAGSREVGSKHYGGVGCRLCIPTE